LKIPNASKEMEKFFEMDYIYPGQYRFKRVTQPLSKIENFFRDTFETYFQNAKVELIQFEEREPHNGIDYFYMKIVYSVDGRLDTRTGFDFERYLIHNLEEELNEERFPVMSYIEYNDYLENTPKEFLA